MEVNLSQKKVEAKQQISTSSTLHYQGCGCPNNWKRGQTRVADLVDLLVLKNFGLFTEGRLAPTRKLTVHYIFLLHYVVLLFWEPKYEKLEAIKVAENSKLVDGVNKTWATSLAKLG